MANRNLPTYYLVEAEMLPEIFLKVMEAKELLQHTNLSVSEICSRVGYNDLKHFTQTFKKETSLSPAQYRRLYG